MFLGMQWYWWLALVGLFILAIPLKVKYTKKLLDKASKRESKKDD